MKLRTSHAAPAAATGLVGIACFQAALALAAPWGQAAWGGTQTHLPPDLRVGSAVSAVMLGLSALVVLARAGHFGPAWAMGVFRWGTWALVPLLALSAAGNFASPSRWENLLMGPLALLLSLLCLVVARGPLGAAGSSFRKRAAYLDPFLTVQAGRDEVSRR
jgi:hypothetical protein